MIKCLETSDWLGQAVVAASRSDCIRFAMTEEARKRMELGCED
jgi:hypothetical protein